MAKVTLRAHYRPHKRVQVDPLVHPDTGEIHPSMTKQEFVGEANINNIIKQYKTAAMAAQMRGNAMQGRYEDLVDAPDFQEALHQVEQARQAFMTLPSHIRSRFGNEPVNFLGFLQDPANKDEAIKLGLVKPAPPPKEPVEVVIKTPPSPKPAPEPKEA